MIAGVVRVELAPIASGARLASAVALALNIAEQPHRPLLDVLLDHLIPKTALLILDNCEHVIGDAAALRH